MSNTGDINKLVGQEAFGQVDLMNSKLDAMVDKCAKVTEVAVAMTAAFGKNSAGGGGGLKEQITLAEQLKNVNESLTKSNTDLARELAVAKEALRQQNAENRLAAKETLAAKSSYDELNARLERAKIRYKAMTDEQRESTTEGKKLLAQMEQMSNKLKELDAGFGVHTRKVGDYKGELAALTAEIKNITSQYAAMSAAEKKSAAGQELKAKIEALSYTYRDMSAAINMSYTNAQKYQGQLFGLTQVFRELPGFTYSAQTGILGLSNNLPILADGFKKVASEVNQTTGKVNGTMGALKIFGASIFSFSNIFAIAIGLFTIFSKDIFDFFGTTKKATESVKSFSEALHESAAAVGTEIAHLQNLYSAATDVSLSMALRKKAVNELQSLYPDYLKNLKDEAIMAGQAQKAYEGLVDSLIDKAIFKAVEDIQTPLAKRIVEMTRVLRDLEKEKNAVHSINANDIPETLEQRNKKYNDAIAEQKKLIEATKEEMKGLYEEGKNFFSLGGKTHGDPKEKKDSKDTLDIQKANYEREKNLLQESLNNKLISEEEYYQKNIALAYRYYSMKYGLTKEEQKKEADLNNDLSKEIADSFDGLLNLATEEEKGITQMAEADNKASKHILDNIKKLKEKRIEAAKEYTDYVQQQIDAQKRMIDQDVEEEQKALEKKMKMYEAIKNLASSYGDLFSSLNGISGDRASSAISQRSKALQEYYETELRYIEQSSLSEKEKAQAKKKLDAEVAAQQKQIDRDKITAMRRQAVIQKGIDIANLIGSTTVAVMAALGAKPYTSLNIALAAGAAAKGAGELARLVATPLPQYAKGRLGGPEEIAIVSEEGQESKISKSGKFSLLPQLKSAVKLNEGDSVLPADLTTRIMNAAYVRMANGSTSTADAMQAAIVQELDEVTGELKGLRKDLRNKNLTATSNYYNLGGFEIYKQSNRM